MKKVCAILLAWGFLMATIWAPGLGAFYISEVQKFQEGLYTFKMEVQVYGRGSMKKNPLRVTSFKVKIKNEKSSFHNLKIKSIRAYPVPERHSELETLGYTISPAQWVTKYYRFKKEQQPLLTTQGFFQIEFEDFSIRFNPCQRQFQGPRA